MEYEEFLEGKRASVPISGFDPGGDVSDVLFPHQRDIVRWCVCGGRRAIFAAFGLGKSIMQLEIMCLILAREGGRALIVCPLGVRQEFKRDAELIGVEPIFVRRTDEVGERGLYLTNYESVRDGRLDVSIFTAASLDEASVLRSFGSKTYQTFLALFDPVPYRFVATATPSPNRYKELIHYAGYLGIMDTGQALTRFFQRDSTKANNLTLYPHKEREFWLWVSSWAAFVQRPSDLGYSDDGYELPDMQVVWHEIPADDDRELQIDAHAFWRSSGERSATPEELAALPVGEVGKAFKELTRNSVYDYESHVRIGEELDGIGHLPSSFMALAPASWHPEVWDDVNRMLTLNTEQSRKRQQMHVCPLQFDIVDRLIERYSNPGELVYDPFGGLMTVPLRAMAHGRRGRGTELNAQYWADGVKYLQAEERKQSIPSIFDFMEDSR